jgi:galactokinase
MTDRPPTTTRARAPARVNLIGDHTDYCGGLTLPMAVNLYTEVVLESSPEPVVLLSSSEEGGLARVDLETVVDTAHVRALEPAWARYVAAIALVLPVVRGGHGRVTSGIPTGAGLSSSAALEVALALALGFEGGPFALARACQRAEHIASGVPCGLMDQLTSTAGVAGHALLIDFAVPGDPRIEPVALPPGLEVVVVHSGRRRDLASSEYALRREECQAAASIVGPLGRADQSDLASISDGPLRRRARHVITENERVRVTARALMDDRPDVAGEAMSASHSSLAHDFECSTPELDSLVADLVSIPGVYGARLTGAGFGGCAVALCERGAVDLSRFDTPGWCLEPVAGATAEASRPGPPGS